MPPRSESPTGHSLRNDDILRQRSTRIIDGSELVQAMDKHGQLGIECAMQLSTLLYTVRQELAQDDSLTPKERKKRFFEEASEYGLLSVSTVTRMERLHYNADMIWQRIADDREAKPFDFTWPSWRTVLTWIKAKPKAKPEASEASSQPQTDSGHGDIEKALATAQAQAERLSDKLFRIQYVVDFHGDDSEAIVSDVIAILGGGTPEANPERYQDDETDSGHDDTAEPEQPATDPPEAFPDGDDDLYEPPKDTRKILAWEKVYDDEIGEYAAGLVEPIYEPTAQELAQWGQARSTYTRRLNRQIKDSHIVMTEAQKDRYLEQHAKDVENDVAKLKQRHNIK